MSDQKSVRQVQDRIVELKNELMSCSKSLSAMTQNPDLVVEHCCDTIEKVWKQNNLASYTYSLSLSPCLKSNEYHWFSLSQSTIVKPCHEADCTCIAMMSAIIEKCRDKEVPVESISWSESGADWYTDFCIQLIPVLVPSLIADATEDPTDLYDTLQPPRVKTLCHVVGGDNPHLRFDLNDGQLLAVKLDDGNCRLHLCKGNRGVWTSDYPRNGRKVSPEDLVKHVEQLRELK